LNKSGFAKRFKNIEKYKHTDGHIYALEAGWDFYFGTVVYYNKEIFAKYGLNVPKSFDDFINVCMELRKQGISPFAVPAKEYWGNTHLWDMMTYVEDPKAVEKLVNGQIKITDPVFMNAAKRIRKLYEIKAFQEGATNYNWADTDAYFRAQKAAMLLIQTWSLFTYVSGADPLKFEFDYMTFPPAKPNLDLSKTFPLHYDPFLGFSVSAKTKHPKEAVRLLEWLVEQDAKWALEKIKMPVTLDIGMKLEGMHPLAEKWVNDISNAEYIYPEFGNHFDAETINEFTILVQKLINGDIMPEDFIKDADKAFKNK
jgi:raffinose/stachyose/melibiose transport system substrate-binding protein